MAGPSRLASTVPIALFLREHGDAWQTLRGLDTRPADAPVARETRPGAARRTGASGSTGSPDERAGAHTAAEPGATATDALGAHARAVLDLLRARGASFSRELSAGCALDDDALRRAICELVAAGRITSDGFAGVRGLIRPTRKPAAAPARHDGPTRRGPAPASRIDLAGRWSALRAPEDAADRERTAATTRTLASRVASHDVAAARGSAIDGRSRRSPYDAEQDEARPAPPIRPALAASAQDEAVEQQAWALLRRYGVVFRRLLAREANAASWRDLTRVYRRLEARGEIRGGRFVSGMSGEQFALGEAVDRLREVRRTGAHGRLLVISAADPLNLAGIITPGDRVRAVSSSRIVYRDGVPLATMEGDYLRPLADIPPTLAADVASALAGRRVPPVISGYIGRTG